MAERAVWFFSWTGGSPMVDRQRQTGGQSQVGQSDSLDGLDGSRGFAWG